MGLTTQRWAPWILLGALAGAMVWTLGLARGFEQGLDRGVQALETGQVQLVSSQGGFEEYFFLMSMISGISGVEAVAPRMEFPARVFNNVGKARDVTVRAINFVEEEKVTEFQKRVIHGVSGPISGLLVPKQWEQQSFLFPTQKATLVTAASGVPSAAIPVTGTLQKAIGLGGEQYAFLDLGTARLAAGPLAKVTSLVIRLKPNVDPKSWIAANRDSFSNVGGQLKAWDDVSLKYRAKVVSLGGPLFLFRTLGAIAAFLGLMVLAWKRRLLTNDLGDLARNLWLFTATCSVTIAALVFAFPLWEGLLLGGVKDVYPYVGSPDLPWASGWEVIVLPLWSVLMTLAVSSWRAGRPEPVKAEKQPPS